MLQVSVIVIIEVLSVFSETQWTYRGDKEFFIKGSNTAKTFNHCINEIGRKFLFLWQIVPDPTFILQLLRIGRRVYRLYPHPISRG